MVKTAALTLAAAGLAVAAKEAFAAPPAGDVLTPQPVGKVKMDGDVPPRRLSNDPLHKDYHPSLGRVGLRIDGAERKDVTWYDVAALRYTVVGDKAHHVAQSIEPFWRFEESRQLRRRRERWEAKRGRG